MNSTKLFLFLLAGSAPGWAATSAVQGPMTGFVFDPQTRAVRPMVGIPGAAYLGTPVIANADSAFVSPDGKIALAMQKGQLTVYAGLGTSSITALPAKGAIRADLVAWAADGASAAIYSRSSGQVQILSSLSKTTAVGTPIDFDASNGQVTALGFDGQQVIAALSGGSASGIYSMRAASAPQRIANAVSPSAIAFAAGDLYFTDNETQQIWQVHNYASQPAVSLFANAGSKSSAVGLQVSADGARVYVADAGSRALNVYDVASHSEIETIALAFTPTRLERFGDAAVFVMNSASQAQQPLYVVTDGAQKRAVYFVPAPADMGTHRPIHYHPAERP